MRGESWRSPGAKASKRGYVPLEGYWFDTSQDDHQIQPSPQDDHSHAALGLRVLPVAISQWRLAGSKTTGGERRRTKGALRFIWFTSLRWRTTDS